MKPVIVLLSLTLPALVPATSRADPPPERLTEAWVVRAVLQGHPATKAAAARVEAAAERPEQALGLPDPMLMVEGWPAYRFGHGPEMLMYGLRQDVPLGSARSHTAAAARGEARAVRAEAVDVEQDLVLAARLAYLRLAEATEARIRREEELELARATTEIVRVRVSTGASPASAALSAMFLVTESEAALETVRGEERAARAALLALVGRPASTALPPPAAIELPPEPAPAAELVSGARARVPALRALAARRSAAESRVHAARARGAPMITLEAAYMHDLMEEDGIMATVGVSLPIFPGARGAEAREARAAARALEADAASFSRTLAGEIASTREALVAARARAVIIRDRLVPQARAHHDLATAEFARGQTDLFGLLEAMRHHVSSRLEEVTATAQAARLHALLDRAVARRHTPATAQPEGLGL